MSTIGLTSIVGMELVPGDERDAGEVARSAHRHLSRLYRRLRGDVVLLDEQDRGRWDQAQIAEALPLVGEAMCVPAPGPFALQSAIAAVHARARRKEDTDWEEIVRLYDRLHGIQPSPIVSLNRAVAVAMVDGPAAALAIIDGIARGGALDEYHLLHAARADLLRRIGASDAAERSYARALELVGNDSERRFLERRLRELRS
jgi:RNA polymerase sigma-70 factor, ECF subfamily